MKISDYKLLSFDTFGTLIDWESGIWTAMQPLMAMMPSAPDRDDALAVFAELESAQQEDTPDMIYSLLLEQVYKDLADGWDLPASDEEAHRFGLSVRNWPAFSDAAESLAYLSEHFSLVTLTNCDRLSYKSSNAWLGDPWDAIYTAQDVGSYKPSPRNFDYMLRRIKVDFEIEKGDILHVAQSLFHDHTMATEKGLATCWIDRRQGRDGYGATMEPEGDFRIDFKFASMKEFVAAHKAELA